MSEGERRCPLSCRVRNTTGSPAISPMRSGADGSPQGLATRSSRTFSRPGRSYTPEPPMMPRTDFIEDRRMANGEWRPVRNPWRLLVFYSPLTTRYSPRAKRASVHVGPHLLLGEVHQPGEDDQEDHHLEADALARLEMRLGRPHHECGDVPGVLVDRGRAAVGVIDAPVGQRRRHRNRG